MFGAKAIDLVPSSFPAIVGWMPEHSEPHAMLQHGMYRPYEEASAKYRASSASIEPGPDPSDLIERLPFGPTI